MPQIVVTIDDKTYRMACAEGEEEHLLGLASDVDRRVTELRQGFGEIGDLRLTVMAAIMLTDELGEVKRRVDTLERELGESREGHASASNAAQAGDSRLADHLSAVSDVIERLALKLERG